MSMFDDCMRWDSVVRENARWIVHYVYIGATRLGSTFLCFLIFSCILEANTVIGLGLGTPICDIISLPSSSECPVRLSSGRAVTNWH